MNFENNLETINTIIISNELFCTKFKKVMEELFEAVRIEERLKIYNEDKDNA